MNKEENNARLGSKMKVQKDLPEDVYDYIMAEARRVFEYQNKIGNPYAMHKAIEWAHKEIDRVSKNPVTIEDLIKQYGNEL